MGSRGHPMKIIYFSKVWVLSLMNKFTVWSTLIETYLGFVKENPQCWPGGARSPQMTSLNWLRLVSLPRRAVLKNGYVGFYGMKAYIEGAAEEIVFVATEVLLHKVNLEKVVLSAILWNKGASYVVNIALYFEGEPIISISYWWMINAYHLERGIVSSYIPKTVFRFWIILQQQGLQSFGTDCNWGKLTIPLE